MSSSAFQFSNQWLRATCVRFACVLVAVSTASVSGQGNSNASSSSLEARARGFEQALAAFKTGDVTSAEAFLFQSNRAQPFTLDYRLESAGKLRQAAFALREKFDFATSVTVARRALALLAETPAQLMAQVGPAKRARLYEEIGLLQEKLLVDLPAAKAAFEQALRENNASPAAVSALHRLQELEAKSARVNGGQG